MHVYTCVHTHQHVRTVHMHKGISAINIHRLKRHQLSRIWRIRRKEIILHRQVTNARGTRFSCLVDYAVLSCLNLSHIRKAGRGLQKTPLNYRRDTAFNEPCRLLLKINGKKTCSCLLIEFGKLSLLSVCEERSTGKVTSMSPSSFVVLSGKSCLFSKAWLGGLGLVFCFLFLFGLLYSCCLWNYFILP